jgi:probable phosphoglycerate mutase
MSKVLPIIYLARHGETAWTLSGQHTGLTDLPLTERGERNAYRLEERLRGLSFARVFTSPLQRATRTCELAGFGGVAEIDRDLLEWNYGAYEGRLTSCGNHRRRECCPSLSSVQNRVLLAMCNPKTLNRTATRSQ